MGEFISLGELSREFNIPKTNIQYWVDKGLIKHSFEIGRMYVYKKNETVKKINKILSFKKAGKSLKEIKELI